MLLGVAVVLGVASLVFAAVVIVLPDDPAAGQRRTLAASTAFETAPAAPGAAGGPPAGDGPALRVAIAPVVSPETSLGLYHGLVDYLAERTGRRGVMIQRHSYSEINSIARHGSCDLAFVCTYAYVQGNRDFGLQLLAVPQVRGRTTYQSFVIVRKEQKADSILDMKGTRLASTDILSNTGWLYPEYVLHKNGHDIHEFFSEIIFTRGHDRAIRAIASGVADCAAIDSVVYEQVTAEDPSLAEALRVIGRSPEFGMPPFTVPPGTDAALRDRLRDVLLGMHENANGRAVLSRIGVDRFLRANDADYAAVREMIATVEAAK
ncbi:MAG: PhnD/SsuA/transferrin family substrate-binding protein [Deltaproteobacteria bacterium]|nr:PhnD/SsuA/transferrin family substrate-binding protein [Deltaproteobacteria bacterium]